MGFLTKNVEDLKKLTEAFCTKGCVNCYWYSADNKECPGNLVVNLEISLEELKRSISIVKTDILRLL